MFLEERRAEGVAEGSEKGVSVFVTKAAQTLEGEEC